MVSLGVALVATVALSFAACQGISTIGRLAASVVILLHPATQRNIGAGDLPTSGLALAVTLLFGLALLDAHAGKRLQLALAILAAAPAILLPGPTALALAALSLTLRSEQGARTSLTAGKSLFLVVAFIGVFLGSERPWVSIAGWDLPTALQLDQNRSSLRSCGLSVLALVLTGLASKARISRQGRGLLGATAILLSGGLLSSDPTAGPLVLGAAFLVGFLTDRAFRSFVAARFLCAGSVLLLCVTFHSESVQRALRAGNEDAVARIVTEEAHRANSLGLPGIEVWLEGPFSLAKTFRQSFERQEGEASRNFEPQLADPGAGRWLRIFELGSSQGSSPFLGEPPRVRERVRVRLAANSDLSLVSPEDGARARVRSAGDEPEFVWSLPSSESVDEDGFEVILLASRAKEGRPVLHVRRLDASIVRKTTDGGRTNYRWRPGWRSTKDEHPELRWELEELGSPGSTLTWTVLKTRGGHPGHDCHDSHHGTHHDAPQNEPAQMASPRAIHLVP